jgi:RNA polymerase-associated protein RTF1
MIFIHLYYFLFLNAQYNKDNVPNSKHTFCSQGKPKKKKPAAGRKPSNAADDNDDLVEDEEDAARLAKMSEFDREMLLAERAEQRQQKLQRDQILAAEVAAEQAKAKGAQRRSGREVREETAKKSAIEELKAARKRKAQGRKAHDDEDIDAAGGDDDDDDQDPYRTTAYSDSEEDEEDGEHRLGGTRWEAREPEEDEEADEEADFEELKSIQVRRHKLEEWISKPHFTTTLPGCMVRVVAGEKKAPDNAPVMLNSRPEQRYMVVQVVGVEEVAPGFHKYLEGGQGWKSPYPFGPDGVKTSSWLRVKRGKSERLWPLAQVSNSGFTEEEFASWHRACESVGGVGSGFSSKQITRGEVAEVHKRLIDADRYVYTAEDVARMLEKKRMKGQGTRNVAIEMARLERERDAAIERNDEERLMQVQQEIAALEATAAAAAAAKEGASASMAQLNKKNAEKNFKSAFSKSGGGKDGGGGGAAGTLDPFSRRATRTKNYWNTKSQKGGEETAPELTEAELADLAAAEAAAAAAAAAKAEAAEITLVDLSGLDLSVLDLPPKVAPIARKLLGSSLAVNKSSSASTINGAALSLADYKRRYTSYSG